MDVRSPRYYVKLVKSKLANKGRPWQRFIKEYYFITTRYRTLPEPFWFWSRIDVLKCITNYNQSCFKYKKIFRLKNASTTFWFHRSPHHHVTLSIFKAPPRKDWIWIESETQSESFSQKHDASRQSWRNKKYKINKKKKYPTCQLSQA